MNILVYGINYAPELTGIGKYTAEMCTWLAAKGHQVTVITAMPYYPEWKVHHGYQGKWWHREKVDGVTVCRVPLYVPANVTGASRMVHEFSFSISSLVYIVPALFQKFDVVITICPPFHLGFQGLLFKWLRATPVVYHIQDLQVDAARKLGLIKNQKLLGLLERAEKFIITHASKTSSISDGMKKNILRKGLYAIKYIHFPNWVDVNFIRPLPFSESLREQLGYQQTDKIVLYSGNLGEKQGLEIVLEAAQNLKHIENLYFIFAGEGANKQRLADLATSKDLSHVRFIALQPYAKLAQFMAIANVHLVIQKEAAGDLLLPSKLMTILAAGGLAVVTAHPGTSLYHMVFTHQIALLACPENPADLSSKIVLALHPEHGMIKNNARKFAMEQLSADRILSDLESELIELSTNERAL